MGYEPQRWAITGTNAEIPARDGLVDQLTDHFKTYVSSTNQAYRTTVEKRQRDAEEQEKLMLQKEREEEERSLQIRERLRKRI
jgi:hypothetical protein